MKAYEDLTPRGKLQRTKWIALAALEAFGFTEARLRLIVDAGNTMYRVKTVDPTPMEGGDPLRGQLLFAAAPLAGLPE
ncbi:MAG: hypothetical protein AYK19_21975 [Theionarchaea archaeon DG-70-1]|nr:MAG: hypothetical protein AYK19_21975 [Theionarchaea archaeon DG-70-1]